MAFFPFNIRISSAPLVLLLSSVAAILLKQADLMHYGVGLVACLALAVIALMPPWQGILAVMPLAFALPPAPTSADLPEIAFSVTLCFVTLNLLRTVWKECGVAREWTIWWKPLTVALTFIVINLIMAWRQDVNLVDWIRGVVPFVMVLFALPVAWFADRRTERMRWLLISFFVLAALLAGHIVLYYLANRMWALYWLTHVGGEWHRVFEPSLAGSEGLGPFRDRITMNIAGATDAVLPVALVSSVIVATLSEERRSRWLALGLGCLMLVAILFTYTRSMLISAICTLIVFGVSLVVWRRNVLKRYIVSLGMLMALAIVIMICFSLWSMWLGRVAELLATTTQLVLPTPTAAAMARATSPVVLDENVTTRIEEFRIAWSMFLDHPVFGNGFGIKHAMTFAVNGGEVLRQMVGYVHNWIFYILMVGGVVGALLYTVLLHAPIYLLKRGKPNTAWFIITGVLLTMSIYGLFFGVFRMINFNLMLGCIWGVTVVQMCQHSIRHRA